MFHLFLPSSILAKVPFALGDGMGAERGGSSVGLRQGALLVGTRDTPSLPEICVLLEASQTSRPASQEGEYRQHLRRREHIGFNNKCTEK